MLYGRRKKTGQLIVGINVNNWYFLILRRVYVIKKKSKYIQLTTIMVIFFVGFNIF